MLQQFDLGYRVLFEARFTFLSESLAAKVGPNFMLQAIKGAQIV